MATQKFYYTNLLSAWDDIPDRMGEIAGVLTGSGYFQIVNVETVNQTVKLFVRHIQSNRIFTLKVGNRSGNGAQEFKLLGLDEATPIATLMNWEYNNFPPQTMYFYLTVSDKAFIIDFQCFTSNEKRARLYGISDTNGRWYIGNADNNMFTVDSDIQHAIIVPGTVSYRSKAEQYIYVPGIIRNTFIDKIIGMTYHNVSTPDTTVGYYDFYNGQVGYAYSTTRMFIV